LTYSGHGTSRAIQEPSLRIQLYRGGKETLLASMRRIHRTAGEIIRGIGAHESLPVGTERPREVKMGVAA